MRSEGDDFRSDEVQWLGLRLSRAFNDAVEALSEAGELVADVPSPALPPAFERLIVRALSEGDESQRAMLELYHCEVLQRRRVEVLGRCGVQASLLHERLEPGRFPRFVSIFERLFRVLRECGVSPEMLAVFRGASDAVELVAGRTLAELFSETYYGRYSAPLYTSELDLRAYAAELDGGIESVIDRRLSGVFLHEFTHLQRNRDALGPPYLDECIAAVLGARVAPELVVSREDDAVALYGAGWFTQVGEHFIRALGFVPVVLAHSGRVPWRDILPTGLADHFEALGWEQHLAGRHMAFLGEAQRPEPWIKALWLGIAGEVGHSLPELDALSWEDIPCPSSSHEEDRAFFRAASEALAARPRPTPEGAWRVVRGDDAPRHEGPVSWPTTWSEAWGPPFRWVSGPLSRLRPCR